MVMDDVDKFLVQVRVGGSLSQGHHLPVSAWEVQVSSQEKVSIRDSSSLVDGGFLSKKVIHVCHI